MSIRESLLYRSPVSKLLAFFHRSRDNWKAKCMAAKRKNKSLKYCLAKMKENRDHWRGLAREAMNNAAQGAAVEPEATTKNPAASRARRRPARPGGVAAR